MSLHRYEGMTFFPFREESVPSYIGRGPGTSFNVNVAWETGKKANEEVLQLNEVTDLGCNEYKHACDELLFPIARQFQPDLILISCGFDSAIHD
jgi:acetoin utilization deacetylase AcuC-like enzyme